MESELRASRPSYTAFKRAPLDEVPYLTYSTHLSDLFAANDRLPPSPLEAPGLPFDRLLLQRSVIYKSTRLLARKLGIVLVPEVLSIPRSLTVFDPCDKYVTYSPAGRELRWSLKQFENPNGDFHSKRAHLDELRNFMTSVFHDLNHRILFSTLIPIGSRRSPETARRYFAMAEALAMTRDMQLCTDLGRISYPLTWVSIVYRYFKSADFESGRDPSFEEFRGLVTFIYAGVLGVSESRYKKMRSAMRKSASDFPTFHHSFDAFVRKTVNPWLEDYTEHYSGRLTLPPPARNVPNFELPPLAPEELMSSEELLRELFRFFQDLFGARRTSRRLPA